MTSPAVGRFSRSCADAKPVVDLPAGNMPVKLGIFQERVQLAGRLAPKSWWRQRMGEWGNSARSRETERATALGRQATLGDGTEVLGFLALPCRMRRPLLMTSTSWIPSYEYPNVCLHAVCHVPAYRRISCTG